MRAVGMPHADGYGVMSNRSARVGIDEVGILPAAGLKVPAICAGSANRFVCKCAGSSGVFDGNDPAIAGAQFTARFDEEVGVAAAFEILSHLIDSPPDRDAREVHLQRGMLFAQPAVEGLQLLPAHGRER